MKQLRGFKSRFDPTDSQRLELAQTFGCTRFVYNWALALRTDSYYKEKNILAVGQTVIACGDTSGGEIDLRSLAMSRRSKNPMALRACRGNVNLLTFHSGINSGIEVNYVNK